MKWAKICCLDVVDGGFDKGENVADEFYRNKSTSLFVYSSII